MAGEVWLLLKYVFSVKMKLVKLLVIGVIVIAHLMKNTSTRKGNRIVTSVAELKLLRWRN